MPEPAPKRKTLIERAGEPARSNVVAPSHVRPPSSASVRGTSSSCSRNPSLLSATSLQTPSVTATSAVSNGVSSSKSGSESQAASARAKHPKTTEVGLPQTAKKPSRPASSLDNHTAATDKPALGKRKGMSSILSRPSSSMSLSSSGVLPSGTRSVDGIGSLKPTRVNNLVQDDQSPLTRSLRLSSLNTTLQSLKLSSKTFSSNEVEQRCSTPSQIPKLGVARNTFTPIPATPAKSIKRSPSPKKIPFLTRESHTLAWDTKGRLEDMEYLYSELKQKMDGTVVERNGLEEAVDLYKSRSASPLRRVLIRSAGLQRNAC